MINLLILTGALLNPTPIAVQNPVQNTPNDLMSKFNSEPNITLVDHWSVDENFSYSISSLTKEIERELQNQLAQIFNAEMNPETSKSPLDEIAISNNY